jgi:hypothetical protein
MVTPPVIPTLTPPPAPSFSGGVGSTIVKEVAKAALNVASPGAGEIFGVSASRLIAIAVGLIVVAVAVFSFRPVRETVVGVSKNAAKAAVVA